MGIILNATNKILGTSIIRHDGAGESEMVQQIGHNEDENVHLADNLVTGIRKIIRLRDQDELSLVTNEQITHWNYGLATQFASKESPSVGISGAFHVLPKSIAWLWRVVAPTGNLGEECLSTPEANALLTEIKESEAIFTLLPVGFVGAWRVKAKVLCMGRNIISGKQKTFTEQRSLFPARYVLFGYAPKATHTGQFDMPEEFLRVEKQVELGTEGYDLSAGIIRDIFITSLESHLTNEIDPLGRAIIELFLNNGSIKEFDTIL